MYNAIFATDSFGGIGYKGSLPWPKSTEDFEWFKSKTSGQIVVMGRRTWDDPCFPKPLPNRINVVLTSRPVEVPSVLTVGGNVERRLHQIQKEYPGNEIFFIGGKHVIEQHLHLINRIYLTKHRGTYIVDVSLDLPTVLNGFALVSETPGESCTFMEYRRNANLPFLT